MAGPIQSDANILGGTPCFAGTRVPVETLFDHLRGGHTLDYYLSQFPSVKREAALAVLDMARAAVVPPRESKGQAA